MKIHNLGVYPLSGARRVESPSVEMYPMGPRVGDNIDRQFVLYDPVSLEVLRTKDGGVNDLFLIEAKAIGGALCISLYDRSHPDKYPVIQRDYDVITGESSPVVVVNEFNQDTPLWDMGGAAAWRLSQLCKRKLRLGQKTTEWLSAPVDIAKERAVAPLHVVSLQSLQYLGKLILDREPDDQEIHAMVEQARAGMVVDLADDEYDHARPWPETEWGDDTLFVDDEGNAIGDFRPCKRCEVPGKKALTGEKSELFIPGQYRKMPKVPHTKSNGDQTLKPVFGAYAVPNPANGVSFTLEVGQELRLVAR
jgi:hypothetical protein